MGYRINRSEREQQLLNMLFSYLGEHYDSSELYEILHHDLGMTHSDIELLGFDLKDCYCMESNEINMGRLNLNAETDLSRLMERPMLLSTVHLSLIDRTSGEVEEALYDNGARYPCRPVSPWTGCGTGRCAGAGVIHSLRTAGLPLCRLRVRKDVSGRHWL